MAYHYSLQTGVTTARHAFRRYVVGIAAAMALALGYGLPTFAASNDYCGSSANGCEHAAAAGAQCGSGAGSGAFGAFGKDNNFAGGANGHQTGLNNSALCGNRQGNL